MNAPDVVTSERTYTLAEFQRLPEDGHRTELVEGRLVREPPPGPEHGWLLVELAARIREHVAKGRLGLTLADAGFVLSEDPPTVRGPDIAFVARKKLPSEGFACGYWKGSPDLAVEVVSPSNTRAEIREKVLEYLAAGTRLVWVVELRSRSVTTYRSRTEVRRLSGTDTLDGLDVLPGFSLRVADLFVPPDFPRG
jgi:Uma2 family endonuclease